MHLAVQTFQLSLPGCGSLKEKRMVVKSLRARIRNRFNVAVSETGAQDILVRAESNCAARRRLLVPTVARSGRVPKVSPERQTKASAGLTRSGMAPSVNSAGDSVGRSLRLWTAASMLFPRRAASSSAVNRPLPPIKGSGVSRI